VNAADAALCLELLTARRWGALATVGEDGPFASMVAFALAADRASVLLHLSTLAPHTGNLVATGRAGLVVSQPDPGEGDPQTLARVSLAGPAAVVERDDPGYPEARARYLACLPTAEPLFSFGDFRLFRLVIERVNFVGGFARAQSLDGERFARDLGKVAGGGE
jgi:hypothetical protein